MVAQHEAGRFCGIKVHHWAYILTLLFLVREMVVLYFGFAANRLLVIPGALTISILMVGVLALLAHGRAYTYRFFFLFY
ncbi:hypothetical protein AAVH_43753, partial [Aphelenchoides avenae]